MTLVDTWDSRVYINSLNFGHKVFVGENGTTLDSEPEYLKLYDFNALGASLASGFKYEPFSVAADNYAVMSLFMGTRDINKILKSNNPQFELQRAPFFSKYIRSILCYNIITSIERPTFRYRMYFDFHTLNFLNMFTKESIPDFLNIIFNPPHEFVHNQDHSKTVLLRRAFTKVKEAVEKLFVSGVRIGDMLLYSLALAYMFLKQGNTSRVYSSIETETIAVGRLNYFEIFLYNLGPSCDAFVEKLDFEFNGGKYEIYVHGEGGFIGSVTRTFAMRQHAFEYNGITKQPPKLIIIRDAHRCLSTSDDPYIQADVPYKVNSSQPSPLKKYDWVHNIYYWAPWHVRDSSTSPYVHQRGPIFYYINARRDVSEPCIMPDEHWAYTFGRIFQIMGGSSLTTMAPKLVEQRKSFGQMYRSEDVPSDTYKLGVCYGIDEFLSTYCVYDENNRVKGVAGADSRILSIYDNSRWIQMYYNWNVIPALNENGTDKLDMYGTKEGRAFCYAAAELFRQQHQQQDSDDVMDIVLYVSDVFNDLGSVSPDVTKYIPTLNSLHGHVGYAHSADTNYVYTIIPEHLLDGSLNGTIDYFNKQSPKTILWHPTEDQTYYPECTGTITTKGFNIEPAKITEIVTYGCIYGNISRGGRRRRNMLGGGGGNDKIESLMPFIKTAQILYDACYANIYPYVFPSSLHQQLTNSFWNAVNKLFQNNANKLFKNDKFLIDYATAVVALMNMSEIAAINLLEFTKKTKTIAAYFPIKNFSPQISSSELKPRFQFTPAPLRNVAKPSKQTDENYVLDHNIAADFIAYVLNPLFEPMMITAENAGASEKQFVTSNGGIKRVVRVPVGLIINRIVEIVRPVPRTSGGSGAQAERKYVKYKGRRFVVMVDKKRKSKNKYITCDKTRVYLSDIKGQFRYVQIL